MGGLDKRVWPGGGLDLAALNVGCGRGCARCPPSPSLPTPRLHFIYSVLALVTGWAWTVVPRMCAELHLPSTLYILALSHQSAPHPPPAWVQNSLLLQGRSPSVVSLPPRTH